MRLNIPMEKGPNILYLTILVQFFDFAEVGNPCFCKEIEHLKKR